MEMIFVFGSNLLGIHGKGAALDAKNNYGAIQGQGFGRQGNSYAIPTKSSPQKSLPLEDIQVYVSSFVDYANNNTDTGFFITAIGCGLAGYTKEQIAPMFKGITNKLCIFPEGWWDLINE